MKPESAFFDKERMAVHVHEGGVGGGIPAVLRISIITGRHQEASPFLLTCLHYGPASWVLAE